MTTIENLAFYRFVRLPEFKAVHEKLRHSFQEKSQKSSLRGTLLISAEGINGFLAGTSEEMAWARAEIESFSEFKDLEYKVSWSEMVPFTRMLIKLKREIIPMRRSEIIPEKFTAPRVKAQELKTWLSDPEKKKELVLLDTRNAYEVELGTFDQATEFKIRHFQEFEQKLEEKKAEWSNRPMVMFCTGGIRCEKAGALALQMGFKEVYQLEGGILKYFEECGGDHYNGDCFVFDHRVALTPKLEAVEQIKCYKCQTPLDRANEFNRKYFKGKLCLQCC